MLVKEEGERRTWPQGDLVLLANPCHNLSVHNLVGIGVSSVSLGNEVISSNETTPGQFENGGQALKY